MHRLTYALLPGATIADAVAEGYSLNLPLRVRSGSSGESLSLVDTDAPGVPIEAVKLADDRSGDVVVRLYEALGGRASTRVRTSFPIAAAEVVDLLERPTDKPIGIADDGTVPVTLRPFQVLTLRLRRG
jgi:alpha-mannosidase